MSALINYAISHARLTLATLAFLLVAGFIAYKTIPKEAEPDVKIPIMRAGWYVESITGEFDED